MAPHDALGTSGRTARVIENCDVVRIGEIARARGSRLGRGAQEVDAVLGSAEREDEPHPAGAAGQFSAAFGERLRVDEERVDLGILDLREMVGERTDRVKPRRAHRTRLCRESGTPRVGAICR